MHAVCAGFAADRCRRLDLESEAVTARNCVGCNVAIVVGLRERNPRIWCSDACRVRRDYARRKAAGTVSYWPRSTAIPRDCNECGRCYIARSSRGKFCSSECANSSKRRVQSERYAADPQKFVALSRRNRAAMTAEQKQADLQRRREWRQRNGYLECNRAADQRRRARKRGSRVEKFTSVEIFERDGWRCGICSRKVRTDLKWPHPKSGSLDHIVPISLNGEHTRANVRLAHLDCNVKRGNRVESEQLALIG